MDNKEQPTNVDLTQSKPVEVQPSTEAEVWHPQIGVLMIKLTFNTSGLLRSELGFVVRELPVRDGEKRAFRVLRLATGDRRNKNESYVAFHSEDDTILNQSLVGRIPLGSHYEYLLPVTDKVLDEFVQYLSDHQRAQLRLNVTEGKEEGLKVLNIKEKSRLIASIDGAKDALIAKRRKYMGPSQRHF